VIAASLLVSNDFNSPPPAISSMTSPIVRWFFVELRCSGIRNSSCA
jgi:hypothetical protein